MLLLKNPVILMILVCLSWLTQEIHSQAQASGMFSTTGMSLKAGERLSSYGMSLPWMTVREPWSAPRLISPAVELPKPPLPGIKLRDLLTMGRILVQPVINTGYLLNFTCRLFSFFPPSPSFLKLFSGGCFVNTLINNHLHFYMTHNFQFLAHEC